MLHKGCPIARTRMRSCVRVMGWCVVGRRERGHTCLLLLLLLLVFDCVLLQMNSDKVWFYQLFSVDTPSNLYLNCAC